MAISDYSTTPGNNAAISGINIAEGCAPANVNNAMRQMMADLASTIGPVTGAELAILDGATVTTAELNILDGVTASTAEINALDGVTAAGTAMITAASGAAQRALVASPPTPTASVATGQWTPISSTVGGGLTLPATGTTWAYFALRFSSGVVSTTTCGVGAASDVVGASAGGQNWNGFAWRVE
jgi:hypothetical protein